LIENDDIPLGGRLWYFVQFWQKIAPNREMVSLILGAQVPFTEIPNQRMVPIPCRFTADETLQVPKMVNKLLEMKATEPVKPANGQFVSQIFLVTNKDLIIF
jgi:hypothetical protein